MNRQSAARNRRLRSARRRALIREAVAAEVAAILADRERPSAA
jgi:hypothetical protein